MNLIYFIIIDLFNMHPKHIDGSIQWGYQFLQFSHFEPSNFTGNVKRCLTLPHALTQLTRPCFVNPFFILILQKYSE